MNQNYNIKINSQQPSSKDIARHQDFDALLATYDAATEVQPRGRIRQMIYYGSAAAAAVALLFYVVFQALFM